MHILHMGTEHRAHTKSAHSAAKKMGGSVLTG